MKIDDLIKKSKDAIPNLSNGLKDETFIKIQDINKYKTNKLRYLKFSYRFVLSCTLFIFVLLVLVPTIFSLNKDSNRITKDLQIYHSKIFNSKISSGMVDFPKGLDEYIRKNDGYDLILLDMKEQNNEYIGGYIKKDIAEVAKLIYDSQILKKEIFANYDNAFTGKLISYYKSYILDGHSSSYYDLPKEFTQTVTLDGIEVTKSCVITEDDVRWYKYNNINDVKKEIEGYTLDFILTSRNYIVKENVETGDVINKKGVYYYPQLYTFNNGKIVKLTPNEDDKIWGSYMSDFGGSYFMGYRTMNNGSNIIPYEDLTDYISSTFKPYNIEYSYGSPYKIVDINGKRYIKFFDENRNEVFGMYALYFYPLEVPINTNEVNCRYYDYEKVVSLIRDIYSGKVEGYYKIINPWPKQYFFERYGLESINKPLSNFILQIGNYGKMNLDNVTKEYFDYFTKAVYEQGYNASVDSYPNIIDYDNLIFNNDGVYIFNAVKKFNDDYIYLSVSFNDNKIEIDFR